ncbi:hypothetical protein J2R99_000478 [Rhodopseudomonas julia]|uniref:Uncharacterized protein n=1 Tax=Rhodopseudomonas julia TaxID=200617 RepID=A0ABU0C286_9BRAD|nr:hypothetical protein [Rhodopseudomonas julia]MDQ0324629.1 hypothetical protein [Rhodopseudomonas julia]
MASRNVTIDLDSATLTQLSKQGARLYTLRAVTSADRTGQPTVWCIKSALLAENYVSWDATYEAYISTDPLTPYEVVRPQSKTKIAPSQVAIISASGILSTQNGDLEGRFQIENASQSAFTCGIIGDPGVGGNYCAFHITVGGLVVITPTDKAFFMFASQQFDVGTIISQSFGAGIIVDLPAGDTKLTFNIDAGWNVDSSINFEKVAAGEKIQEKLIIPSQMIFAN